MGEPHPLQIDLNPLPDPWEAFQDIVEGIIQDIMDGVAGLIEKFNWLVFSLPAPGEPSDPATWTAYPWEGGFPGGWWNGIWEMYWGLTGVGTIGLAALAVYHHTNRTSLTGAPINHHDRTREAVKAFVLVVLGWILLAFYIHGMNALTIGVAPSGGAFLSTPGNISKLGLGLILGALLLAIDAVIVLIGLLVLLAQWLLMLFVYAVFPAAVIARASGSNYARVMSGTIISLLIGLPLLKFIQVLMLRFVFSLPMPADPSVLLTMIVTMVGVFLAFIALPIEGTKRLLPNAIIAAGGSLRTSESGLGGGADKQTAAAVSAQSTQLANQVRVGPDSASQRVQPTRAQTRTPPSNSTHKQTPHSTPPLRSARSAHSGVDGLPAVAQPRPATTPVSDPPNASAPQPSSAGTDRSPVTVNTAIETNNTAVAQAHATAPSKSGGSSKNTQTNRPLGSPSPWRPLKRAKRRIEQRRQNANSNGRTTTHK